MNNSNGSFAGDGRAMIVLGLFLGLLFYDLAILHNPGVINVQNTINHCEQLHLLYPNTLVVQNCLEQREEPVPARFTPFFFQPIPINSADREMLMTVKGIGPALANNILVYRQEIGTFKNSLDLQKLHGVGSKYAAKLNNEFTFSEIQWHLK